MDTKALRQKILDLAIRGKLVPQDPNDEPASVLLERIRAEKQQMVKDGKLKPKDIKNDTVIYKGDDNLHYEKFQDGTVKYIEDEIPFELPEGWEWTRLKDLLNVCSSKRVLQSDWKSEGIPFYRAREIVKLSENDFVDNDLFISEEHYLELKEKYGVPQPGDLMVSGVGTIGKVYIVKPKERFYYKDASVLCFENKRKVLASEFAKILLESSFVQAQMKDNSKGTTVDTITISTAMNYLCVVPPKREQIQIVSAVKQALVKVIEVQTNKDDLQTAITIAKAKILDLAIRGKLVPQDPNDEPASVLLERIRAEKEELIKQGKIKRDKKESVIFKGDDNSYYLRTESETMEITDELPYEIPESWEWERIGNVFQVNPRNKLDDSLEVSFIPMPLIDDGFSGKHTSEVRVWKKVKSGFTHFMEGDIGIAKITPCFENRKSVVFKNLKNNYGAGTTELHILRPYASAILPEYILAYVKSSLFIDNGKQEFTGAVGQQRISKDYVENSYFPIPPLTEQARIVEQIHTVYKQLNSISDALL